MIGGRPVWVVTEPLDVPTADRLRELYALAYIEGLQRHERPQEPPAPPVRLDTPGRAPIVRLRPAGGDRA